MLGARLPEEILLLQQLPVADTGDQAAGADFDRRGARRRVAGYFELGRYRSAQGAGGEELDVERIQILHSRIRLPNDVGCRVLVVCGALANQK